MYIIAGPCAIEDENFVDIAHQVKRGGATHIRGGVFKPRSSPFRWNGIHEKAIPLLKKVREEVHLPIVVEVMSKEQIAILYPYVDIFQVGTRNATNTELLKELGRQRKPVLYKRGMAQTIEELVMGADFILNEGNSNVILCERGIRTFETYTRNTFDISCIPSVKELCDLPIIADPSHGTGRRSLIIPVSRAAIAAGADGIIVEVHNDPDKAMTDSEQSIDYQTFKTLVKEINRIKETM